MSRPLTPEKKIYDATMAKLDPTRYSVWIPESMCFDCGKAFAPYHYFYREGRRIRCSEKQGWREMGMSEEEIGVTLRHCAECPERGRRQQHEKNNAERAWIKGAEAVWVLFSVAGGPIGLASALYMVWRREHPIPANYGL